MIKQVDDGGPAFPEAYLEEYLHKPELKTTRGMTLRDWFAGMAMQAIISNQAFYSEHVQEKCVTGGRGSVNEITSNIAYAFADAMIESRKPTEK